MQKRSSQIFDNISWITDHNWMHFLNGYQVFGYFSPCYLLQSLAKKSVFCIFPYEMTIFLVEKTHLNRIEKLPFCQHFITSIRALWKLIFRKKSSSITKLFNFENCVILAQIRSNLRLSNLDIFEIFDTADENWLPGLSNDISIIF